jgi:hypothetical protein
MSIELQTGVFSISRQTPKTARIGPSYLNALKASVRAQKSRAHQENCLLRQPSAGRRLIDLAEQLMEMFGNDA